jgi:hypothetical protein
MLSIAHLENPNCHPNEGGVGPCLIYGGNVGSVAHDAVTLGWLVFAGAPIALGAYVIYVIVAIFIRLVSRRRGAPSVERAR